MRSPARASSCVDLAKPGSRPGDRPCDRALCSDLRRWPGLDPETWPIESCITASPRPSSSVTDRVGLKTMTGPVSRAGSLSERLLSWAELLIDLDRSGLQPGRPRPDPQATWTARRRRHSPMRLRGSQDSIEARRRDGPAPLFAYPYGDTVGCKARCASPHCSSTVASGQSPGAGTSLSDHAGPLAACRCLRPADSRRPSIPARRLARWSPSSASRGPRRACNCLVSSTGLSRLGLELSHLENVCREGRQHVDNT